MSAATILRARIEELSLAIERQKQVLQDLEKSRSNAQRDLNATLDPMARLPVEISSDIFACCIPDSPRPYPGEPPIVFLSISRIWRDIATSTPSLWSSVHGESCANAVALDNWLRRARSMPLRVSLSGTLKPDVAIAVKQHAPHLEVLKLEFQHLNEMASPFPSLAELTVIHTTIYPPTHRQCMDILRSAPALVECIFISTYWQDAVRVEAETYPPEPFTHPSLRNLKLIARCETKSKNAAYMLVYLTLPALRILLMSDFDITTTEFSAFLTRSAPPLQTLFVVGLGDNIVESLQLVPSLVILSLETEIDPFFIIRDTSPQNFLPNLQILHLRVRFPLDVDYEFVIGALAVRSAAPHVQLGCFKFASPNPKPQPDVIAALRRFALDSEMEIHVGTDEQNYV
ncbi:hypothetical protein C8R45DRAFT_636172 [Mycena sanguinolenta]|nr:hypothetical protein C8R45DRAFT_636172 [Mycena sanguinolenta]